MSGGFKANGASRPTNSRPHMPSAQVALPPAERHRARPNSARELPDENLRLEPGASLTCRRKRSIGLLTRGLTG